MPNSWVDDYMKIAREALKAGKPIPPAPKMFSQADMEAEYENGYKKGFQEAEAVFSKQSE